MAVQSCLQKASVLSTRLASLTCLFASGETLEGSGIKNAIVLQSDEGVVLTAQEEFDDTLPDGESPNQLSNHQKKCGRCKDY